MTASPELSRAAPAATGALDGRWRALAERGQQEAMPSGATVVSCSAPLGAGGLGRHFKEFADALTRNGEHPACISGAARAAPGGAQRARHPPGIRYLQAVLERVPLPVSPGVRTHAFMSEFDAYAAARLPAAAHLIAFNGQALRQFSAARRAGFESIALISANSHLRRVIRRHERAREQYPLEGSWAARQLARNLREYALAERIYVGSAYTRDSFLEEGFPEERLVHFPFTPDPRFAPPAIAEESAPGEAGAAEAGSGEGGSGRFELVYTGSLAVHKGVPLLIDAVRRLAHPDLCLRLVGGWGSRGMRRFVQRACAEDARIVVSPGDPLPHLRAAALCVHPSYEDGFAYAPAEALACGVPVLVSEDTGMKELIDSPRHGLTLPTGDLDALAQAIDAAYRGELFGTILR